MKRSSLLSATVLLLMLCGLNFSSQFPPAPEFKHYMNAPGIKGDNVFNIFQDREGFIWVGTDKGLNRFDGREFINYHHDPSDPSSLSNNLVFSICEDQSGRLWIGTRDGGINVFDKKRERFRSYTHDPDDPDSILSNNIYRVLVDSLGNIWIGSMGGLDRFDPVTEAFEHVPTGGNGNGQPDFDSIVWLYESESRPGLLWISTYKKGLKLLDIREGILKSFMVENGDPRSIPSDIVLYTLEDNQGYLWVGTDQGICRYDYSSRSFTRFQNELLSPGYEKYNYFFTLAIDQSNRIWGGTANWGIQLFHPDGQPIKRILHQPDFEKGLTHNHINHIFVDRQGMIWIGTLWGLNSYNPLQEKVGILKHLPRQPESLSANLVHDIIEDRQGHLWIATANGLNHHNPSNGDFTHYLHIPYQKDAPKNNATLCVFEDTDGTIWAGTESGLLHLNLQAKEFVNYSGQMNREDSLSNLDVLSVYRDSGGDLWVGTRIGLNRMIARGPEFERFFDHPEVIGEWFKNTFSSIAEDDRGRVWFGTEGGGLYFYENDRFTRFSADPRDPESLPSDFIYDLQLDDRGNLWIATGAGLCMFKEPDRFHRFKLSGDPTRIDSFIQSKDGDLWLGSDDRLLRFDPHKKDFTIISNIKSFGVHEFSKGAACCTGEGELYFGCMDGLMRFHPSDLKSPRKAPPLVITGLKYFGKSPEKQIGFSEKDNVVVIRRGLFPMNIEFNALDLTGDQSYHFAYQLSPGEDWIDIGTKHDLTLHSLKPGKFFFKVRYRRPGAEWNQPQVLLKVVVLPAFWQKLWFKLLILCVFVFLFSLWHIQRVKGVRKKLSSQTAREKYFISKDISSREREVIDRIIAGKSNQAIADELYISLSTVKNHVYNIYQKLKINSRMQLMSLFQKADYPGD